MHGDGHADAGVGARELLEHEHVGEEVGAALHEFDRAVSSLEEALDLFKDIEDRYGEGYTLVKLGDTYSELKQSTEAIDFFEQALEVRREVGDRWGEGETLQKKSLVLDAIGQHQQATECLRAAVAIFDELGDPRAADLREILN